MAGSFIPRNARALLVCVGGSRVPRRSRRSCSSRSRPRSPSHRATSIPTFDGDGMVTVVDSSLMVQHQQPPLAVQADGKWRMPARQA